MSSYSVRVLNVIKATHNQSQRFQNQLVNFLFSIQMCSVNPTLYTVDIYMLYSERNLVKSNYQQCK